MPSGRGKGERLILRAWQIEIIIAVYGPVDDDGLRVVEEAILSMPRKNGKTLLIAALALCHLIGPEAELNGEVYSAAADQEQAAIVFKYASQMIKLTPELVDMHLAGQLKMLEHKKRLIFYPLGTFYQALSKAPETKHGANPSVVICDEMAQWKSPALYDVLTSAFGAREEPLTFVISTQAANDNHLLSELIDYGLQVNAGEIDNPRFVCRLYTANPDDDIHDPATWARANPALGDFLTERSMRSASEKAKGMKSREAEFRNLRLNQRVDAAGQFLLPADWDACAAPPDTSPGRTWGATDLGIRLDLTSTVTVTERIQTVDESGEPLPAPILVALDVQSYFWMPEDGIRERAKEDLVPYDVWAKDGLIELTPGRTVDRGFVAKKLFEIAAPHDWQGMAYDRFHIESLRQQLNTYGDPEQLNLIDWGQGFISMASAVNELEEAVLNVLLRHGGNKVLRMCAANAITMADPAANRKLDKKRSRGRIDGLVSLAMALGLRARQQLADDTPPPIGEDYELDLI